MAKKIISRRYTFLFYAIFKSVMIIPNCLRALYIIQGSLFSILILFNSYTSAQKSYRLSTDNGLSSNNLTVVIKDRNNYMWIGSYDGVQKLEGSRVKVYRSSPVDSLSLSSNQAHSLFEDRKGFIWAATMEGVDRINPATDVIRHYTLKSRYTGEQGNGYPYSIFQDKKDSIWITNGGGLFRLNDETGGYNQVEENNTNGNGVYEANTGYKASYATETGIWLYTLGGIVFYEYRTGKFYGKYYNPQKKKIFDIEAGGKLGANSEMCNDKKGNLYFISRDSVLIKYNIKTEKTDSFPFARPPLSWQCCYSLACDYEDNIWIGFRQGGILLFNQKQSFFTPIHYDGVNSLIGSNYIYSLAEDYLRRMWVTTDNGVYIIDRYNTGLRQFYLSDKKEFTNLEYDSGMFTEDDQGNLYLPFHEGGLFVFKQSTGKEIQFLPTKKHKSYSLLYPNYENKRWLGCDGHLYKVTILKGKLSIDTKQDLLSQVTNIPQEMIIWMLESKNALFIKTLNNSIFVIQNNMPTARLITDGFMKQMALSPDSKYFYYINPQSNISRRNITSGKEDTFSITSLLQKINFNYTAPRDLADDGRGNLWIASQNGLIRYHLANHSVETYTMLKGLSNNFSFALCVDRNKNLWVATLGGISRYDTVNNRFNTIYYLSSSTYEDGFGSGLLLKNGKVAFHIGNRLIIINADSIQVLRKFPKQLKVTDIAVNGKPMNVSKKKFSLTYNENRLLVKFGLLDFENASKVNYYYQLNEPDSNWVSIGNRSELFFYSLSPGSYSLKVKAVDGSGNPVPDKIELSFVIHPPFYKTIWFISLLVFLAGFAGMWMYLSIRKKYKQQKILNVFIASLSVKTAIDDMMGCITDKCVEDLGFQNCGGYILDDEKNALIQKASNIGSKSEISDNVLPPEIALGKGTVGKVCQSLDPAIINDTVKHKEDNENLVKSSEIIVPLVADGHVFGAIYSWYPKKYFFTKQHLSLLKEVAGISAIRISKYFIEERLRSKIAQDLHDDLGSALSSININSKMALERDIQQTSVRDYLQKIKNNSGNMMESMSDIVWAIDPQNDTLEKVVIRMKEFAAEILETSNISYHFFEEINTEAPKLDLNKRKNIYLIFKESINNAAKYSRCTDVEVHIRNNNNSLILVVNDNGKGFDNLKIKKGNGLRNMQERAFKMGAAITVRSAEDKGTVVHLEVPLT